MTLTEQIITIAMAVIGTMATRFLPFLVFSNSERTPVFIKRLGDFLPPAILGILVVYCYKDVLFTASSTALFSLVAGLVTLAVHLWRRNMFLSIFVGTACYVLLCNFL
ncbi:branched-chain amino acid transporter permease [Fructobacillus ficulneus]|uniref:Branched-chain amino acid transport protein AzlD n=1 Tax=Fructobacillus ficulneus TaxID=157463 RepID=A0A0K8MIG0_9LACO|nr:AzlD domain-containing protein [Fructobacillus ficulneus]GAP00357.1 branched-chain amino acid transport protein AzlD [Fructobacillus ficulneus]